MKILLPYNIIIFYKDKNSDKYRFPFERRYYYIDAENEKDAERIAKFKFQQERKMLRAIGDIHIYVEINPSYIWINNLIEKEKNAFCNAARKILNHGYNNDSPLIISKVEFENESEYDWDRWFIYTKEPNSLFVYSRFKSLDAKFDGNELYLVDLNDYKSTIKMFNEKYIHYKEI